MDIRIFSRSKAKKDVLEKLTKFYVEELNLTNSRYRLVVTTTTGLKKENGWNGYADKVTDDLLLVVLDSRLSMVKMMYTLAHEMVHVKQFAKGQYKTEKSKNGKHKRFWMGKRVALPYAERPWELEAFKREDILVTALFDKILTQKEKKKKK
jgi:hypothetical protein